MPLVASAVTPTWKKLRTSALIAFAFAAFEYAAALYLVSLAAEADATHLFGDGGQSAAAALFAYIAARTGSEYWERRGAYFQALCLTVAGAFILWRLAGDHAHPRDALAVSALGVVATLAALWRLRSTHGSLNLSAMCREIVGAICSHQQINKSVAAEVVHVFLDLVTSVFVLLSGLLILSGVDTAVDRYFGYAGAAVAFGSALVVWFLARAGHHHDHCGHDHTHHVHKH